MKIVKCISLREDIRPLYWQKFFTINKEYVVLEEDCDDWLIESDINETFWVAPCCFEVIEDKPENL